MAADDGDKGGGMTLTPQEMRLLDLALRGRLPVPRPVPDRAGRPERPALTIYTPRFKRHRGALPPGVTLADPKVWTMWRILCDHLLPAPAGRLPQRCGAEIGYAAQEPDWDWLTYPGGIGTIWLDPKFGPVGGDTTMWEQLRRGAPRHPQPEWPPTTVLNARISRSFLVSWQPSENDFPIIHPLDEHGRIISAYIRLLGGALPVFIRCPRCRSTIHITRSSLPVSS